MYPIQGKKALLTGASAGLGAAVARHLSQRGALVAINYAANEERANATLASLHGSGHVLVRGDALSKDGVREIFIRAIELLGGIDIVISNVGWTAFAPFNDIYVLADSDWIRCYESNVLVHLWLMQACKEALIRNKGCMVITSSVAGLKPSGSSMAYAVSKAATIHLTKSLAIACSPHVRVNSVAAGVMRTDWSKGFSDQHFATLEADNSLKKIADVDDVALAYVHLVENASMTGQCIEISAGFRL